MRLLIRTAIFALLAFPALAQAPATTTPRPTANRLEQPNVPLPERFADANSSKDGQLTRPQARASYWYYVDRNFEAMDKDRKGFVTVEDIRGYARMMREKRAAEQLQAAPNKS